MRNIENKKANSVMRSFLNSKNGLTSWVRKFINNPEDVEDIVQETFVRTYIHLVNRQIENPEGYLFTTAKNLALKNNNLSCNKVSVALDDLDLSEVVSLEDPVMQAAAAKEEMSYLCEAIRKLPLQCRRVFVLKRIYGLSHQEIADRLEISPNTVHLHLAKGVARCTDFMKKHGFMPATGEHKRHSEVNRNK